MGVITENLYPNRILSFDPAMISMAISGASELLGDAYGCNLLDSKCRRLQEEKQDKTFELQERQLNLSSDLLNLKAKLILPLSIGGFVLVVILALIFALRK